MPRSCLTPSGVKLVIRILRCWIYFTENFSVDIKCTERNKASQQHFPGSGFELPFLLNAYTERVEDEKQKQDTVYGADHLDQNGIAVKMFSRYGNAYQNK